MTFKELGLRVEVLQSIEEMGFAEPTPIQQSAIPHLLQLESDFVGLAQTGTGKTAAFGLPLIHKVTDRPSQTQGLVIAPTRELCLQISKDLQAFAQFDAKINVVAVYGGTDIRRQMTEIKRGATIVVATPGRLVDLIHRKAINLHTVETVVLDEADEMLNMGFKEDIDEILDQTPDTKNVWLFSATMPKEVAEIAKNYMDDPLEVTVGHKNQSNENIEHIYYCVKEKDRYDALKRLIDASPDIFGLVFCRTRNETASVAEKLMKDGYSAEPLHGDLSQAMRDRVMERFRERSIQLLVATDVAARGIDVDNISHVINYNLPDDIENYTHRSGRTARAGRKGKSLVLINTRETHKIKAIERQIRMNFTPALIPSPQEICGIQLNKLIAKIKETEVREKDIAPFIDGMMTDFIDMSKEDLIKKFISAEFNRFIEYYDRAGDLNVTSSKNDHSERGSYEERKSGRERRDNGSYGNRTRFFVSLGKRDGLNPGGLLRVICDSTGLKSANIGRIDVMPNFSFFEADKEDEGTILSKVNGTDYEGHRVNVEITTQKRDGGQRRDDKQRRDGGRKDGFSGKKEFGKSSRKDSDYGKSKGGFGGSKTSSRRSSSSSSSSDRSFGKGKKRAFGRSSGPVNNY